MDAVESGRQLAERHRDRAEPDPTHSLLNYAEAPYDGDWTLRSALMRLAQPEPARVGSVLEVMRRLDAVLHHVRRGLERHTVICDRGLTAASVGTSPAEPYPDARTVDLARLVASGCDETELYAGYESVAELDHEEKMAVPLLAVALTFADLAAELTAWSLVAPGSPPVETVDRVVAETGARLDELGVPVETGPPPGTGRSGRSGRSSR